MNETGPSFQKKNDGLPGAGVGWSLAIVAGLLGLAVLSKSKPQRVPLRQSQRKRVFVGGEGKCYHCGKFVPTKGYHVDHSNPVSKGGTNHMRNLKLSCAECNLSKGTKRWRKN